MRKTILVVRNIKADMKDKKRVDENKTADQDFCNPINLSIKMNNYGNIKSYQGNIQVHKGPDTELWRIFFRYFNEFGSISNIIKPGICKDICIEIGFEIGLNKFGTVRWIV